MFRLEQVIDRFGDKLYLRPNEDGTFSFNTKANISEGLISWLMQFGNDIEVVAPAELRKSIIERIDKMTALYKKSKDQQLDYRFFYYVAMKKRGCFKNINNYTK